MNEIEISIKNYLNFLKDINNLNIEVIDRFFSIKYIYAEDRDDIIKEKDPIKKLLMSNYFLMSQFKILYDVYFNDEIKDLEIFLKRKNIDYITFKDDIEEIRMIFNLFNENYGKKLEKGHVDIIDTDVENIYKELEEHYFLANKSLNLSIKINQIYNNYNFEYKKLFFESNKIKILAKSLISRFPFKTIFREIRWQLQEINNQTIDKLEEKGYFKE